MPDFPSFKLWLRGIALFLVLTAPARAVDEASQEVAFTAALELMEEKFYDEAAAVLERLVKREPKNGLFWFNLGSARYNAGEPAAAAKAFERVVALQSPLMPAALLSIVKCRRRSRKWQPALNLLKRLPTTDPGFSTLVNLEREALRAAALEKGMDSYDEGRFEEAQAAFRVANELQPDADVTFMLGIALMRLDRNVEAERALGKFQRMSQDSLLRDDSRSFLDRIGERRGEGPAWLSTELALGYNSNLFLDSSSGPPDKRGIVQTLVHSGWRALEYEPFRGNLSYLLYWEEAIGDIAGRFLSQTVRGELDLSSENWRARLYPSFQHQLYGTDPFLFKPSLGFQVQVDLGNSWFGMQYEVARNYGQLSEYRYLNGNTHGLRISAGLSIRELEMGFSYGAFADGISDLVGPTTTLPLRSSSHGPTFRLSWEPDVSWEYTLTLGVIFRKYPTLAQPGNFVRRDGQLSTSLRVAHKLNPGFHLFGSLNGLVNQSTLDSSSTLEDRNYGQFMFLTGVSWDILN